MEKHNACAFFGHKEIKISDRLKKELCDEIERLIVYENFEEFYFGGLSDF